MCEKTTPHTNNKAKPTEGAKVGEVTLWPQGEYCLVRHLRRPTREGSLWVPSTALRTKREVGEAASPGLKALGKIVATGERFEERYPGLSGRYVVLMPDGGRGAVGADLDFAFYAVEEVLGVVEEG